MWRVLTRMAEGRAHKREIDMLLEVTKQVEGHTICALGDAAAWPIQGLIAPFPPRDRARIDEYRQGRRRRRRVRDPATWSRRSEGDDGSSRMAQPALHAADDRLTALGSASPTRLYDGDRLAIRATSRRSERPVSSRDDAVATFRWVRRQDRRVQNRVRRTQ